MTKNNAETELKKHRNSNQCYLTRYSISSEVFRLSVMCKQDDGVMKFKHFKLNITKEGSVSYEIEGTDSKFKDVAKLLEHYQRNPICVTIKSIGNPIPRAHSDFTDSMVSSIDSSTVCIRSSIIALLNRLMLNQKGQLVKEVLAQIIK